MRIILIDREAKYLRIGEAIKVLLSVRGVRKARVFGLEISFALQLPKIEPYGIFNTTPIWEAFSQFYISLGETEEGRIGVEVPVKNGNWGILKDLRQITGEIGGKDFQLDRVDFELEIIEDFKRFPNREVIRELEDLKYEIIG